MTRLSLCHYPIARARASGSSSSWSPARTSGRTRTRSRFMDELAIRALREQEGGGTAVRLSCVHGIGTAVW